MLLIAILVLLGLGALLGAAGMKRMGRWTARLSTLRWRPGVGIGAILLATGGLVLAGRGEWAVGVPAMLGAVGLAVVARKRGAKPALGQPAAAASMSKAEARALLGLSPNATRAEIQAAYLRLIQVAHPDHGGTSGLASQLNAARTRLLG